MSTFGPNRVEIDLRPARNVSLDAFGFGEAIRLLKRGMYVQRSGWNGKGMHLGLHRPTVEDNEMTLPYIWMRTACGNTVPWLASQTDVLAEDWGYVSLEAYVKERTEGGAA